VRRDAAAGMPADATLVRAPLASLADALAAAGARPSVVVHGINPLYTRWEEALPAARAGMDLAERLGARFMLPGNVYNHGAAMPARIDETTPQRPTTAKGRIRAEMERELARRAAAGRLGATVITAGDFFGAGDGSWLDQVVVKAIAKGRLDYPGDPDLVHAWAYLPDLARAFVAVASLPGLAPFERFRLRRPFGDRPRVPRRHRARRGRARRRAGARLASRHHAVATDPDRRHRRSALARAGDDVVSLARAARPRRQPARGALPGAGNDSPRRRPRRQLGRARHRRVEAGAAGAGARLTRRAQNLRACDGPAAQDVTSPSYPRRGRGPVVSSARALRPPHRWHRSSIEATATRRTGTGMTPEDIDRVFGQGRLRMATGAHVEVFRERAMSGQERRYTKRFLAGASGDFRRWTEREWRILEGLGRHAGTPVAKALEFLPADENGPDALQTRDAGATVDQWASAVPLRRGEVALRSVFEDCAHWWSLARQCLVALDALHSLGFVHLDFKPDNVCVPWAPAGAGRPVQGQPLVPRFRGLALIDVAFSLFPEVPLVEPLPLLRQPGYEYQSPRLLHALEEGRRGNLAPTLALDWRCDLFSLAAMLWRYLPESSGDIGADWTEERHALAGAFVRQLLDVHNDPIPAQWPHRALIGLAALRLREPELAASVQAGRTFDPERTHPLGIEPTPATRLAEVPRRRPGVRRDASSDSLAAAPAPPADAPAGPETGPGSSGPAPWADAAGAPAANRPSASAGASAGAGVGAGVPPSAAGSPAGSRPGAAAAGTAARAAAAPTASTAAAAAAAAATAREARAAPMSSSAAAAASRAGAVAGAGAGVDAAPATTSRTGPGSAYAQALALEQARLHAAEAQAKAAAGSSDATLPGARADRARASGRARKLATIGVVVLAAAAAGWWFMNDGTPRFDEPESPLRAGETFPAQAVPAPGADIRSAGAPASGTVTGAPLAPSGTGASAAPPSPNSPGASAPPPSADAAAVTVVGGAELDAVADELMSKRMPRVAENAGRELAPVLRTAAEAREFRRRGRVRAAAESVRSAAARPQLATPVRAQDARTLNDAALVAYGRNDDAADAVRLQKRAFAANPLDSEVVGNLAFLHLKERPPQTEAARQLALHALTLNDPRFPSGRIEDWTTLAVASALAGRDADARNAWFASMALTSDLQRQCDAAVRAEATYGERLRPSVQAMLQRARSSAAYGRCEVADAAEWTRAPEASRTQQRAKTSASNTRSRKVTATPHRSHR
jgi:hypothetical protein